MPPTAKVQPNRRFRRTVFYICGGWLALNVILYLVLTKYESKGLRIQERDLGGTLAEFEPQTFRLQERAGQAVSRMRYRLMKPRPIERRHRYPLLLYLHGAGDRGDDNYRQLGGLPAQMATAEWRERFPCFLIAPQCPDGEYWSQHMEMLEAIVESAIQSYPVDRRRIYLTGLSMGGFGSWELSARRADLFAAVVPICGGGKVETAARLVDVPIWVVHGNADRTVAVQESRRMVAAIRQAGGDPRYTELKDVGHNSWTQTYRDPNGVLRWMIQQSKNSVGGKVD